MQIYKCDRCGTELKKRQSVFEIRIPIKRFGFINDVMTRELCEKCYREFFDYFCNYDKEEKMENKKIIFLFVGKVKDLKEVVKNDTQKL